MDEMVAMISDASEGDFVWWRQDAKFGWVNCGPQSVRNPDRQADDRFLQQIGDCFAAIA